MIRSHIPAARLRRASVAFAGLATAVVVGFGGISSAGAPPEHTLSLSNDVCDLTIEATVAQAGSYEVVVLDSSMVQATYPINASGGPGTFTFVFSDAPNPPPTDDVPPFPIVELRLVEGGLLVADSHQLVGCIGSAMTTTTTSTTVVETTTTAATPDTTAVSSSPGGAVAPATGAQAIPGSANYTG